MYRTALLLAAQIAVVAAAVAGPRSLPTQLFQATTGLSSISALDLSPDGAYVAVGGADGNVEVYILGDTSTTFLSISDLGFEEINALEFSLQAPRLIVGGAGEVFAGVVSTSTWETEHLAAGGRVISDVHDIGGVVFYLRDASMRQVVMLDMTSTRPHIEFIAGSISLMGHSIDRRRIALVDFRQVMLLDAATMRVLSRTTTMLGLDITSIGLVGQGYTALIGTTHGDLLVLDVLDGRVVDTLSSAHSGAIRFIEVTESGIYTAGDDGAVLRWTGYERNAAAETIHRSEHAITGIGVTYRGEHVAVATQDGVVTVYGPEPQQGPPQPE